MTAEAAARPKISTSVRFLLRHQVTGRSGGFCELGWVDGCTGVGETIHHVVPRADDGADTPENLLHACQPCHDAVHAHTFRAAKAGFLAEPTFKPMSDDLLLTFRRARRQRAAAQAAWKAVCDEQQRIGLERRALKRYRRRMEEQARARESVAA